MSAQAGATRGGGRVGVTARRACARARATSGGRGSSAITWIYVAWRCCRSSSRSCSR